MIIGFKEIITSIGIGKKDMTDTMKASFVNHCPLSSGTLICHPSCNWWSRMRCTYPTALYRKASQNVKMGQGK